MHTGLTAQATPKTEQPPERFLLDRSAMLRRDRAERDASTLRWVLIAVGMLYLVFSGRAVSWLLGIGAIGAGLVINSLFLALLQQGSFSFAWSVFAQIVDILLLSVYAAALQGGLRFHLPFYTTMVVTATIRFGVVGTVSTGVMGVLLYLATASDAGSPSAATIFGAILVDTALLAYFAYLVRQQDKTHQEAQDGLQEQIYEMTVLHEASNIVHDLKSEDALQNIVEIPTKIMRFQRAALFLTDAVGEMLPRAYYSRSGKALDDKLPDIFIAPDLFSSMLNQQGSVVIDGSQGAPDVAYGPILQVAVPLHGDQSPIGVLVADRNDLGLVTQADKEMLSNLARSAVMAIENASLHRQVKRMANHDGLTDLFNHRYFQETLRAAISESQRNLSISLLMIEIDKFKKYNDTFGHRQGDTALIVLARALETATQQWNGLVARYGGDEFVVILPRIDQQEGLRLAREIRIHACQLAEEALRSHDLPAILLSVGVATYPDDAQTATDLIDAADQAMYYVKHNGGNQSHAYFQHLLMRRLN